ncbi:hypothetical protein QEH52_05775 [Coraliomargarita sp. SDUM461003]|uniref:Uncharacterized protein n=1 Tax=Thalassobacterium maritimum TaxID=3041265 RepID=A0ABU1ASD2_9BACT|nr:hypothetical protein [Coraliomargarita sp. SDUM461003]MDQ8207006.1 hypothetical protein [Coraliomargarita sp. SDUM461003]
MSRPQEEQSAKSIVEQIFHDHSEEAKKYYESRLRTRYADPKMRKNFPSNFVTEKRKSPGEKYGGVIFANSENALTYFENLLRLDGLLMSPSEVFKALNSEGSQNLGNMIRARRYELRMRVEPIEQILEESKQWEVIPKDFDPCEHQLKDLESSVPPRAKVNSSDSWKAKLAEKISEIEKSDEWQNGAPDKVAEKAQIYFKMGSYVLAHKQVNAGVEDHPKDPALHYIKACILLEQLNKNRRQAFEQVSIAFENEESALIQLMSCYRNYGSSKLPDWTYYDEIDDPILFKIIELADRCSQRIHETYHWKNTNRTELIEEQDSPLSRDIIHFFTQGTIRDKVEEWWFYSPKNFGTLISYWALMQRIKPSTVRKSVKRWRECVEEAPKRRRKWAWFHLNENDSIRVETPWGDEWPELINNACSLENFTNALSEAKLPSGFLIQVSKALTEHQKDRLLWQRMVHEWRCLSRIQKQQTQDKHLAACKRAKNSLPWSKSAYSAKWKTRWIYAETRCQYNAVISAWPNLKKAREHINKVEQLLKKHPEIEALKHTHLRIYQSDEYTDREADPLDILGNTENIFTSTKASEATRFWGIFTYYNPFIDPVADLIYECEFFGNRNKDAPEGPLERHHAFAEACKKFEGSLYEKALKLLSVD